MKTFDVHIILIQDHNQLIKYHNFYKIKIQTKHNENK